MKALIYAAPETLRHAEAPPPTAREGDVLLRVDAVGICGSDMHAFLGHDERRPPPLILGHEAAGTVVADGRRVAINPLVVCGECENCIAGRDNLCRRRQIISMPPREGAFAELLAMPPQNLIDVPENAPAEKTALAEPLACGWHAARLAQETAARELPASRALVIGGGAIGLGAALALRTFGAKAVIIAEANPLRRKTAAAAGFEVCDAGEQDATEAPIIIDAVGTAASRQAACRSAMPGGVIVHIGLGEAVGGVDARRLTLQEITFIGAYAYAKSDFRAAVDAIFDGRLGELAWTETRPLAEGAAAFLALRRGEIAAAKVILIP